MRAVEVTRFGGPDVLEIRDLPDPAPGPGQVVVAASCCDVLFVDTMIRSGKGIDYFPVRPPYVPGNGVGGTVADIGDGVDAGWLGRPVVAYTGGAGGYAELAAADLAATRLSPLVGQTFTLAEASKAHLAIESRETVAKTLLLAEAR